MAAATRNFADRYGPWAVVAGATQGIGQAFSRGLAARGLNVAMIARREGPLLEESEALRRRYAVETRTLVLDLAAHDTLARVREATDDLDVGFLVYNAAYAEISEYLSQPVENKLACIDVNCRSVVVLTSHFGQRMVERGRGGMLLMSSMSGWQGSAMLAVYAASKAFNTILAESLWSEMRPHGVDVHVCVAGATSTPNFLEQTPRDKQRGTFPMDPDRVVAETLDRLGGGPTIIPGRVNRAVYTVLGKLIPRTAAVRFFSRTARGLYGGGARP